MEALAKGALSAVIAYSTHYGVSKLYDKYCIPDGIWGYLQGMITAGSPVCQTAVNIISSTQVSYSTLITMGVSRLILDFFGKT
jgi:hypothetical protein